MVPPAGAGRSPTTMFMPTSLVGSATWLHAPAGMSPPGATCAEQPTSVTSAIAHATLTRSLKHTLDGGRELSAAEGQLLRADEVSIRDECFAHSGEEGRVVEIEAVF